MKLGIERAKERKTIDGGFGSYTRRIESEEGIVAEPFGGTITHHRMPPNTIRFCRQIIHTTLAEELKIVEVQVFNTRLGLVVRVRLGLVVVGRCCWGRRWGRHHQRLSRTW
jgi:hypothetical protein